VASVTRLSAARRVHFAGTYTLPPNECFAQEYGVKKIHGIMMGFHGRKNVLIRIVHVEWEGSPAEATWSWEPAANLRDNDAYQKFLAMPEQKAWRDPKYIPPGHKTVKPGRALNQKK
jgi:hypothetical protein